MNLKLSIVFLCIMNFFSAQDFANYGKYNEANQKLISSKTLINTIFMGDSITEFWASTDPAFFSSHNFVNRGISGQTTSQMVLRFQQDVIALKPKRVVLLAGINDIAENTGPIRLDNVFKNIQTMVELAKYHRIEVVLCSVLPAYSFSWKKGIDPAEKIIELNAKIKAYAEKNKISYVDYHSEMKDSRNGLPPQYTGDEVHPNKVGYDKMEQILMKVLN